ncbi:MAG: MFS transporter, partial [Pseudomonadota bacterium]
YILVNTLIGLALGPYVIGQISDYLTATGMDPAGALRTAMALSMLIFVATIGFLLAAMRHLPRDESSRLARAKDLGEEVEVVS